MPFAQFCSSTYFTVIFPLNSIPFYCLDLTEATIGSILAISGLLNLLDVHDSSHTLKNLKPWLGNYRCQRGFGSMAGHSEKKNDLLSLFSLSPHYLHLMSLWINRRFKPSIPPPSPASFSTPRPQWDQSFLHMLIIMRFQLKHYLIPVIMDIHVEEVFLSGVDALHAQRAHGRFTKVPFNCWMFQGHTKKGLSSKAWQANSPLLICTRRQRICYEAAGCEILITARMDCVLVLSGDPVMWRYDGIPWGWDLKIHLGLACMSRNKHPVIQQWWSSVPNN